MGALLDLALRKDIEPTDHLAAGCDLPPLSATQEAARNEVLARLDAHPSVKRTFVTRFEGDVLIVTLAIRDVGTGELAIPADSLNRANLADFDALLSCLEQPGTA